MKQFRIWDPVIRVFHWALVGTFAANAFFNDPEGATHQTLGYVVAGLVVLRIVWGFVGSNPARFRSFHPTSSQIIAQVGDMATNRRRIHLGHSPLGALMIYNLLTAMFGIGLTGYMMTTNQYWGIGWVEDLHETLVVWAEISAVAHIAAVLWESRRTGVNLPRAMITGVKSVPKEVIIIE